MWGNVCFLVERVSGRKEKGWVRDKGEEGEEVLGGESVGKGGEKEGNGLGLGG